MAKRKQIRKPKTGTLTDFAKKAKISQAMVTKLRNRGVLDGALIKQPGKKRVLVDLDKAIKFYNERVDPNFRKATRVRATPLKKKPGPKKKTPKNTAPPVNKKSGDTTFVEARAISEQYKAAEKKLDYEIKKGLWILKSEVRESIFKCSRIARDSLSNLPARAAALLASTKDEERCYQILHVEVKEIINEFIKRLKEAG